ncbi:MAG: alpha/beta fold hydrolase [Lacibacter sp.]
MQRTHHQNALTVSYTCVGKGNAVVLIHGFGEDHRIWQKQLPALQQNHKVLLPDLPGTGKSTLNNATLSIDSMAEAIKLMLDEEEIKTCIMLGHSMGGYVTLAFAEKYPERLQAFGLIHSTAYADSEEKKEARKKSIGFIQEYGAFEFMKATIPNLFAATFNRTHSEEVQQLTEQGKQFTAEALTAYYNAMINRPDRTAVLKTATVPVLMFIGEEDKAVNPADALEQASLPAVCMVKLIPGIAHMGMLEATTTLNETILAFITTINTLKQESVKA